MCTHCVYYAFQVALFSVYICCSSFIIHHLHVISKLLKPINDLTLNSSTIAKQFLHPSLVMDKYVLLTHSPAWIAEHVQGKEPSRRPELSLM